MNSEPHHLAHIAFLVHCLTHGVFLLHICLTNERILYLHY